MNQWSNIPGSFVQWDLAELTKLIPLAIVKAQSYGNRNSIRDQAIITVLREFAVLRGNWPSAKEASRFIETIQRCYRELLPTYGFGIGSVVAIYRLLERTRADS